jgi:glycosyltransferase involved in cell wall biosynthesis
MAIAPSPRRPALLCVSNFRPNAGYAWDFIESIFAGVSNLLALRGVRTIVAYPAQRGEPTHLRESAAEVRYVDASLQSVASAWCLARLIAVENVKVVYFTDRAVAHAAYPLLRAAGARKVVVHSHVSGERNGAAVVRLARRIRSWTPFAVDAVIAVSDFVARCHVEAGILPSGRVFRIWNALIGTRWLSRNEARAALALPLDRPVVGCLGRAAPGKGVPHLLAAFATALRRAPAGRARPLLVYIGDGPELERYRTACEELSIAADVVLAGFRREARTLLPAFDVCVVPSTVDEAFCLAALEAMTAGVPVVATHVGALPELIEDGVSGVLVPPGDEDALASTIQALLESPEHVRREMATAAADRVQRDFRMENVVSGVADVLWHGGASHATFSGRQAAG